MTAQQLKNSILQMAVQGKLVPKDPNDEPASVLLERIRAEKEKLIKEGKIKKEKNPSVIFRGEDNLPYEKVGKNEPVCIADEVPFEIPDSWGWARLSDICNIVNGFTPLRTNPDYWNNGTVSWFTVEDIHSQGRRITRTAQYITRAALGKNSNRILPPMTVLLCYTASVGEYAITEIPLTTNQQFNGLVIKDYWKEFYYPDFLFVLVQTFKNRLVSVAGKTTFNFVSVKKLGELLVPILPFNEQKRIISQYNKTIPHVESYDKKEQALSSLSLSFPELLKKSILQQAVMGKLVPQDLNDEPASVLLERIRAEKQALIKAGKLKKDKHESIIYRRDNSHYEKFDGVERCIDEEVPFEIPYTWCWSRLNHCLDVRDGTHDTPKYVSYGVPLVTSKNLCDGHIDFSNVKLISREDHEAISLRSKVDKEDILFAMIGSIGNPVLYHGNAEFSIKNMALFKHIQNGMYMEYVYWWLFLSQDVMKKQASGGVQSFVSLNYLRNYFIPVPPHDEQKRIVEKIKKLLTICDSI